MQSTCCSLISSGCVRIQALAQHTLQQTMSIEEKRVYVSNVFGWFLADGCQLPVGFGCCCTNAQTNAQTSKLTAKHKNTHKTKQQPKQTQPQTKQVSVERTDRAHSVWISKQIQRVFGTPRFLSLCSDWLYSGTPKTNKHKHKQTTNNQRNNTNKQTHRTPASVCVARWFDRQRGSTHNRKRSTNDGTHECACAWLF